MLRTLWEGRFRCQALLDDAAVLARNVYVELNPIRAAAAETPEQSEFTSAYDRIQTRRPKAGPDKRQTKRAGKSRKPAEVEGDRDGWLCPIEAERPSPVAGQTAPEALGGGSGTTGRRASSESFLPTSLEEYLSLLDWTGRQLRSDKRRAIPANLAPILSRLGIASENWL